MNVTGDLLFTPGFFNNKKWITFSNNTEGRIYGYDESTSNRALYAGQVNVSQNLIFRKVIRAGIRQNQAYSRTIELANQQLIHDIDKTVLDQYIAVFQTEQQMHYLKGIIDKIHERVNVVEQLVKKGLMAESDYLMLNMSLTDEENNYQQLHIQLLNNISQLNLTCNLQDTTLYTFEKTDLVLSTPLQTYQYQQRFVSDSAYIAAQR